MSGFEHFSTEAEQLEREIFRMGLALGIDWEDAQQVRSLAREALACGEKGIGAGSSIDGNEFQRKIKLELFGLAQLMLTVMRQSAEEGFHTHGGPVWKVFGRALWQEAALPDETSNPP